MPFSYWRKRKNVPRKPASVDRASIHELEKNLSHDFHAMQGRGQNCKVDCYKRNDLDYFFAYPEDYAQASEEWEGKELTRATLVEAVPCLLGFAEPPQADGASERWVLGLLKGKEHKGAVSLVFLDGVTIALAERCIPLHHTLKLNKRGLIADKGALLQMVDGDTEQPRSGKGSAAWRKQTGKAAADARHNKPGGSRDKHRQIRELWATGKFAYRYICAEQECAALGMSFDSARKALRNTPDPKRTWPLLSIG